jgi:rhodanese-related sulfurtransferase
MRYIDVSELNILIKEDSNLVIIDVRSEAEYKQAHVPQTRLVPIDDLFDTPQISIKLIQELTANQETIYVICLSDGRSMRACQVLAAYNITNTCFVRGGTKAWVNEGYPTLTGL